MRNVRMSKMRCYLWLMLKEMIKMTRTRLVVELNVENTTVRWKNTSFSFVSTLFRWAIIWPSCFYSVPALWYIINAVIILFFYIQTTKQYEKKSSVIGGLFSSNNIKRIVISIWIRKICNLWWAWSVVVHFALLSFPWWAYRLHPGMWSRYQYLSCMIQCVVPFLKLRVLFIAVIYNLWLIICNQDWLLACYMR